MAVPSSIALALIAGLILLAAIALWFGLRRRPEGAPPLVAANHVRLRQDLYQVNLRLINRAAYALGGVSLRCLRPRSARLLAPIKSLSTKEGDFQIWSDPETDKPAKTIALDFVLGPHQMPQGTTALASEAHPAAWLFCKSRKPPAEIRLELTLRDGEGKLYRYEIVSAPAAG
jgi:hypothetical protein